MRTKSLTAIVMALIFVFSVSALAAPQLIDYQGYIEDNIGNPITDTISVTFTIYTASSGGTSKWTETQSNVAILGGLFNVTLGSSTALPDTVFNDNTRYLAITIASVELTPRTRIVSTAYSHRVNTVDGATGGTISGDIKAGKGNFGANNTNAGNLSFVAGNTNTASGGNSAVGGGSNNTASQLFSVVCGGEHNAVTNTHSSVAGGSFDTASGGGAFVGGGRFNKASDNDAVVCGGILNKATGFRSAILGGEANNAGGKFSYAFGRRAKANHAGAFVWADSTDSDFASSAVNQFNVRSSGGTRIYSNSIATTGVLLAAGGGSWSSASDSTLKRNARIVDGQEILSKLMLLPVKQWSYKSQSPGIEHVGPMAQDFYSIFGIGEDDKTISNLDPSGIALAAIQEVYRQVQELQKKNQEIDALKIEISKL